MSGRRPPPSSNVRGFVAAASLSPSRAGVFRPARRTARRLGLRDRDAEQRVALLADDEAPEIEAEQRHEIRELEMRGRHAGEVHRTLQAVDIVGLRDGVRLQRDVEQARGVGGVRPLEIALVVGQDIVDGRDIRAEIGVKQRRIDAAGKERRRHAVLSYLRHRPRQRCVDPAGIVAHVARRGDVLRPFELGESAGPGIDIEIELFAPGRAARSRHTSCPARESRGTESGRLPLRAQSRAGSAAARRRYCESGRRSAARPTRIAHRKSHGRPSVLFKPRPLSARFRGDAP